MGKIELFQIDSFTDKMFHGNPAAVCLMDTWLNDELLQAIALENNLSETAFVLEQDGAHHIRWFTPGGEINLCGHTTLAAAFVIFESGKYHANQIRFSSLSGPIIVSRHGDRLTMDFPALSASLIQEPMTLSHLIDQPFNDAYQSELDYLIVLEHESQVLQAKINTNALEQLPKRGLIITSPGENSDFISRCFYPKYQIPEDPVTGSAHCTLAPFWANQLNKTKLHAKQGAVRQGELSCEVIGDRVLLSGYCRWFSKGMLVI